MNDIKIFNNEEFGDIRTVTIENEPWFVGKDVAEALGYSNASKAVSTHVGEEDRILKVLEADSQNGNVVKTQTALINESGLYALIFGSKLESAKRFKHWVTSEVLPAIRKTGSYQKPMTTDQKIQLLAQGNVELTEKIDKVDKDLQEFKADMPLLALECQRITRAKNQKVVPLMGGKNAPAYKNKSLMHKVYDDTYQEAGSVDVGAMQMSFWWNWDASNPEYDLVTISDTPNEKYKLKPWTECKRADRTITPWCIGSAYVSGIASDGMLRSQPGLKPERNQSHNNMITNYQKKGKGYLGAGSERNTFQILFNIIKGATKNSQSLFQGCTGYSFQYSASIESADVHTYFPVTNAQAQNILAGSYVSVGYGQLNDGKNGVNNDRGVANIHKYADDVKVLKIETLDANNKAVYLDIETGFNTMPIKLSDTVNAPITITSMHWWSGSTDAVIGRHDGSFGSNTDSKHPYRVQGREYAVGGYMVASDTVMDFQSDYSKKVYVAPKGVAHSSSDAMIRNTYTCVGTIPANPDGNGSDFWVGDIAVDVDTGAWFPSAKGSSNSQGFADMVYAGGKTTSGTREYLQGGSLGFWSLAGSACVFCWSGLGWARWYFLGCD